MPASTSVSWRCCASDLASPTVVAAEPVRGLVISGDALKSILRERPGAAMAMLATLADRISTQ